MQTQPRRSREPGLKDVVNEEVGWSNERQRADSDSGKLVKETLQVLWPRSHPSKYGNKPSSPQSPVDKNGCSQLNLRICSVGGHLKDQIPPVGGRLSVAATKLTEICFGSEYEGVRCGVKPHVVAETQSGMA